MTIRIHYSLSCTSCSNWFYAPNSGEWCFDEKDEMFELAESSGWRVRDEVPNSSLWDLCPSCISKEGDG